VDQPLLEREERLRENQALFRTANERLRELVQDFIADETSIPFLCECADEACLGRVELTTAQYQDVRTRRNRYVVLPGHTGLEREEVVEDEGHYQVVERRE
jgi:hypothetical protein